MASEPLTEVIRKAESLPVDEQLQLVGHLVDGTRKRLASGDEGAQSADGAEAKGHPLADRPCVDKRAMRKALAPLWKRLGLDELEPIGPEKLQQRMLEHGVRPEENLLSRGIIEMRE